jgi:hypothetical protein
MLETAVRATDGQYQDCTVCVSRSGGIHVSTEQSGWSLVALAADTGATAVYRIERRTSTVRVEAWSPGGSCVLRRDLPWLAGNGGLPWQAPWARPLCLLAPGSGPLQATLHEMGSSGLSAKDLSPQVRNS